MHLTHECLIELTVLQTQICLLFGVCKKEKYHRNFYHSTDKTPPLSSTEGFHTFFKIHSAVLAWANF